MLPLPRREKRASRASLVRGVVIAATITVAGLTACGGSAHSPAVVRVDGAAIDRATVDHWSRVIDRGGAPGGDARGQAHGTPRQRALGFLISSHWLTGEAAVQGVAVSARAVDRALVERREANGSAEFEAGLHDVGETVADSRLEIGAELSAAAIGRELAQRAARLTQTETVDFYRHHLQPFRHHEARDVELIENLPSPSAAEALVKRIGSGRGFSRIAYHEEVAENTDHALGTPTKSALVRAIFAARRGVVSPPMPLNHAWTVFVVRKIIPATVRPLAEVRAEVVDKLTALRKRRITAAFYAQYRERWRAKTNCRPNYVVQGCAQYTGPVTTEEAPF